MVDKTKRSDQPALDIYFKDGATVSFYVSKHTKAKAKDKHLFLKNPEVLFCSAAEELVCSAPPQVVVQDDSWLKGVDVPDPTSIQYEFKSGLGASPVYHGYTSDEGGAGHHMPYTSREV